MKASRNVCRLHAGQTIEVNLESVDPQTWRINSTAGGQTDDIDKVLCVLNKILVPFHMQAKSLHFTNCTINWECNELVDKNLFSKTT